MGNGTEKTDLDEVVAPVGETLPVTDAPDVDFEMVSEALSFDPFESEAEAGTSPDGGQVEKPPEPGTQATEQQEVKGTKTGSEAEVKEDTPPVAAQPTPGEENPELKLLRDQVEALQTAIKAGQPAPAAPAAPAKEDTTPDYQFTIPTELMSLLDSENVTERQQGIGLLSQGVARTVHQTLMGEVNAIVQGQIPTLVQGMITQQAQAQTIFTDFYEKYPALNKPELRSLIVSTGKEVMTETGANAWSPTLRDTIAQRVLSIVGSGAAPVVPPVVKTPNQPYNSNNGGARPVTPTGADGEIADINDTLFG